MAVPSILNTAVNQVEGAASLNPVKTREAFSTWLTDGNSKIYPPEVIRSCIDRVSDYAVCKKITASSLWEYRKHDAFKLVYNRLLEAKLLRIIHRNTHKVFIVAGQLYMKFLKEKPFACKEAVAIVAEAKEAELVIVAETKKAESAIVAEHVIRHDINPDDVISWLVTQPNANGTLYLENVVRAYMSALRNAPQKLVLQRDQSRNVFRCHTVAEFDELRVVFKTAPNYTDVNRTPWHGQLSAGLAVYRRYLEHLENDGDSDTPVFVPIQQGHGGVVNWNDTPSISEAQRVNFNHPELCAQTKPLTCTINGQAVVPSKQNWSQLLVAITERFIADGNPNLASLPWNPLFGSKVFFCQRKRSSALVRNFQTASGYTQTTIHKLSSQSSGICASIAA